MNLDQLEVSHDADSLCVVIEISKHSNIKYELDKESGALMVDRPQNTNPYWQKR
ncbi:inorganic pyrophosphatase [Helicobacter pylori NY40]|uniref:inorganic diphosphatase n=1 Tax=Helicobacter pylori NY40 TaxID=1426844 RepID=A0A060PUD8_HELPX|nr:inorganic pyrophosphatase [Helicobacter pylori NY40]